MFDLVFLEKLGRWLTNTQIKIRAEVAANNSQSKQFADAIGIFERHMQAAENPSADVEVSLLFPFLV